MDARVLGSCSWSVTPPRADGRVQLDIRAENATLDGRKIALRADGVGNAQEGSPVFLLRENVMMTSHSGHGTVAADHEPRVHSPQCLCAREAASWDEQSSDVVDETVKDHQAATLSSVISLSLLPSSVTRTPFLNLTPTSTSATSSWHDHRSELAPDTRVFGPVVRSGCGRA